MPTNNVSFLPNYETNILMKLDNIIEQNSKIIKLTYYTNLLIARLILGYFTIKLTKYSFKAFFKTFNYFFPSSYPNPNPNYKPYS
jgi:hypothetical protein